MWPSSLYHSVYLTVLSVGRPFRRAYATACRSTASTTPQLCFIWTAWSSERTLDVMLRYRRELWCACSSQSGSKDVVHLDNVAGNMLPGMRGHMATLLFLLTQFLLPIPHVLYIITKHHDQSFNPSDLLPLSALPLPCPLLFSPQWCERNEQCRRLHLRDLLVAPLQRLTRYPLLLRNIAKRCQMEDETRGLQAIAEQVDTSICEKQTLYVLNVLLPNYSHA